MTMIAGFFRDGLPVLMGDLLVSDKNDSEKEFVFPTVGKVLKSHLYNGEYSPSSLCQKAILITPKLAICWAGSKVHASSFIKEIIKTNCHENPSYELLLDIYNDVDGDGNMSIICLYRNGAEMRIFDCNSLPVYCPNTKFRYFSAVGSGYIKLSDIVNNMEMELTSGNPNKLDMGIATSLIVSTSLLSQEIVNPLSLQELFGVGYEIVHPLKTWLAKFTDITYSFWAVEEEETGSWKMVPFPLLTFKYTYCGDILIIRSVRSSSKGKANICNIDSDELHAIKPVYRMMNPDELIDYSPPSLNSKYVCSTFIWKNMHGKMGTHTTFGHYATESPPIIWRNEFTKNEGVDITLEFMKDSISKIALQASQNLPNLKKETDVL